MMPEIEFSEETLRKIVEGRWRGGHITRGGQGREQTLVVRRPWGIGEQFVKVEGAFRDDEMMSMVAAALCAPDLWALVEAARKYDVALRRFRDAQEACFKTPYDSAAEDVSEQAYDALELAEQDFAVALERVEG